MGLIEVIEEQTVFGFTGKINILLKEDKRMLGSIFLLEGKVVNAYHDKNYGMNALNFFVFEDFQKNNYFDFVVEPEIVPEESVNFNISISELKKTFSKEFENYQKAAKLRPPAHLSIVINSKFLENNITLTADEFDLLAVISDYSVVAEVYANSPFNELKTTELLVSLRGRGSLKVIE